MLCRVCVRMLRGGLGTSRDGSLGFTFQHHTTAKTLRESEKIVGCSICKALATELRKLERYPVIDTAEIGFQATLSGIDDKDNLAVRELSREFTQVPSMYQLHFVLKESKISLRTFALKPTDHTQTLRLRTPKTEKTSSDEVLELARTWIQRCSCAHSWNSSNEQWYPKRLLDLNEVVNASVVRADENSRFKSENRNPDHAKIKVVEGVQTPRNQRRPRYVTLSHCWGAEQTGGSPLDSVRKLTVETETALKDGVELSRLPKTFREAIKFACRLDKVGYIWIDSLCIMQRCKSSATDEKVSEKNDWLEQSRIMDKVYARSYLNISATASSSSDQGLYRSRSPEFLWEDEINLNFAGKDHIVPGEGSEIGKKLDSLTRCTVIDVSFWENLVEQAPVNQRGWVLQERIMSPRVLHFCENQIAWECKEFQTAEGYPEDLPTWKMRHSDIVDEGLFKGLGENDGKRLREIRLKGFPDPDSGLADLHVFELWKRVVEVYTRTKLTFQSDKLIALSGIAREFAEKLFSSSKLEYIAGMWFKHQHLESQLLWRVNPGYRNKNPENRSLRHPSAPSFSWASLDVPQGIIYGDTTNYGTGREIELFFEVKDHHMPLADKENRFGMLVEGECWLRLKARHLRKIEIQRMHPNEEKSAYSWRLFDVHWGSEFLRVEFDTHEPIASNRELYCMPAAYGDRTVKLEDRPLICLLLEEVPDIEPGRKTYRRFGVTTLTSIWNHRTIAALFKEKVDADIYLR